MDIYICTYGRAHRQITWKQLPPTIQNRTTLVVQDREQHLYDSYPDVLVLPREIRTVADTRQWLLHYSSAPCVQLDDDLVFSTRRHDDPSKFRPSTEVDLIRLFHNIEDLLEKYVHVGVSHREGANRNHEPLLHNTRQMRIHGYDRARLQHEGIEHNRLQVMEDFDTTLQLLRLGYPNAVINNIVHNQGGSNTEGGVSEYRTIESHNEHAEQLAALHPEYVKVVQKDNAGEWGKRKDVRIQWKKAYSDGAARRRQNDLGEDAKPAPLG